MKRTVTALMFLFYAAAPLCAESQFLDQVAAVVNDEVITQSELDALLRPLFEQYKKDIPPEEVAVKMGEARQKLLNQLVEDRLVFQEAKNQKIEIDEAEIDAEVARFKERFKTDQELEDALHKEGLSLKEMRERIKRQAMIRRLQDMEIRSRVVISPLEIEKYYQDHAEEFASGERIRVRSITIRKDDIAREKGLKDERAKKKIEEIRKKVLSGDSFSNLAKEFSEDTSAENEGLGDWLSPGDMIPEIDAVLFKLKQGEISQVIESPLGYHLFRLEEKQEQFKKTFEEARDEIYGKLFYLKSQERFQEWMKELKRNAYVSVR
jgi:peptidyl-prolyl cis-trans isomerase SurA